MSNANNYDIAFEHYRGYRRYTVSHPDCSGELLVAAPDDVTAIVAAAESWGVRWQNFEFYAFCKVEMCRYKKKRQYDMEEKSMIQGILYKNNIERYEVSGVELTSGHPLEYFNASKGKWIESRVEHDGEDYYIVESEFPMEGLLVRFSL